MSSSQLQGAKDGARSVLLLMDSPTRAESSSHGTRRLSTSQHQQQTHGLPRASAESRAGDHPPPPPSHAGEDQSSSSLGQLLIDMTSQVQDERAKRSEVEKRNHALMLEIEQLQKDMLDLKTSCVSERRRRGSEELEQAKLEAGMGRVPDRDETAEFWWKELQEAKKAREKALVDAHQRAMQVMELNACISMQHDELKALRSTESDARTALIQAEDHRKELIQQSTIVQQENKILKDDVLHLNTEIGKRGVHFKALMKKWTEAQAQSEHFERENHAMLEKMKEIRQRSETLAMDLEKVKDERDCLQHQVNHLKGAVAAKAAESKAFQAYGTNARDHLQAQNAVIQRHQVFRRKINKVARDSVVVVKNMKSTLATIRAPIVAIQNDFKAFLKNLQAPVVSLVSRSRRFAEVAHAEHQPLREALLSAELTRRHLHEQLWKSRRNALLVCQIRNTTSFSSSETGSDPAADSTDSGSRSLRANYTTGELLMKESERETLTVKFDGIYSDRAREWNSYESVRPVVQSVLDGCNACVATFADLLPLRTSHEPSDTEIVPALVLRELFEAARLHGAHFHRIKITISYLGVYNECVYDLLGLDTSDANGAAMSATSVSMNQIVVLEVQNLEEALLVLSGGHENLESAHQRGVLDTALTHKVVTVCLTYENLLSGLATAKSKLQASPPLSSCLIVELAVGSQCTAVQEHDWDDRSKLKALVTMENGVNSLVTALAEVRVKDPAFVRYHGSKLTILLQDTVKASAKFLFLVALPAAIPSGEENKVSTVIRSIQQFRSAVFVSTASPWGKVASRDRSLEGFMNRFAQQQQSQDGGIDQQIANSLTFSSSDLQDRSRQGLEGSGQEHVRWEKELESMNKRYGPDMFATSFFQPKQGSAAREEGFAGRNPSARGESGILKSPDALDFDASDDESAGSLQHSPLGQKDARVHPHSSHEYQAVHPPAAPLSGSMSRRAKSATAGRGARPTTARSAAAHSRTLPDKKKKKQQPPQYAGASRSASLLPTPATRTTYAARVASKPKASSMATTLAPARTATAPSAALKIRRETASSTLKKSRLTAVVTSPFARQQKKKTPFK